MRWARSLKSAVRSLQRVAQPDPPQPRGELHQILLHDTPTGLPQLTLGFAPVSVVREDVEIADRVMAAYQRADAEQRQLSALPTNDVWEVVGNAFHTEFVAALRSGEPATLAAILVQAYREPITHGLGPGRAVYDAARTPEGESGIATLCADRLAALAEAVGAVPIENPEQGRWGVNLKLPPEDLVDRIQSAIGASIVPSMAMGYFGVPIRSHLFFVRSADHAYVAWRCRELGAERVVEIGGGLGGVAYYAKQFGIGRYSIFDLPVMNVIQGYALIKAGFDVSLVGEPDRSLIVRPWWHFAHADDCDVVVNQDSFPEIDPAFVLDYLQQIKRCAKRFLSINQEAGERASADGRRQNVVSELVTRTGGFRRASRTPYWLRRGYVEELYDVVAPCSR